MSRRPGLRESPTVVSPEQEEEILALLERILISQTFRGSRRCQGLLRHLTERTLAGDVQSLKERTIGVEVFGRTPEYDTSHDPVVRATAAEVRKKLAQYYQEHGHESGAHIELVSGAYVVEFHFDLPPVLEVKPSRRRHSLIAYGAGAAILLLVTAGVALERPKVTALEQLWAPLLDARGPVLICIGQPVVYNLKSAYAQDSIQGIIPGEPPAPLPGKDVIDRKDLLIVDRYVDLGDAVSLAHMASLLDKEKKLYHIRGERSTSFADLSDGPSVLIGAFNNQWTLRAEEQLRFTFHKDSVNAVDMIQDRQHPESAAWKLTGAWPNWDVPTDYAIVSRFFDTRTNRPVMIAAGVTHHGTMAAGEFLTNAEYFADASAHFPAGWQHRNLQVVLSVPVVKGVAGRPRVAATYVW